MSKIGSTIKKLPVGVTLKWVDGITHKRSILGNKVLINAHFDGQQLCLVPVELIPSLVVGGQYENAKLIYPHHAYEQTIVISKSPTIYQDQQSGSYWICLQGEDGALIKVRQLELARILFFRDSKITRTAFRPNGLAGLATISKEQGVSQIRFHLLSGYPPSNLLTRSSRAHIAWLLLEDDARKSFSSIYSHWQESREDFWFFNFTPPNLIGWKISGAGQLKNEHGKSVLYADEITAIHNPCFIPPDQVMIFHPGYSIRKPIGSDKGKVAPISPVDPDPELNLHGTPKLGKKLNRIVNKGGMFTFGRDVNTELVDGKTVSQTSVRVDPDKPVNKEETSAGHAQQDGKGLELNLEIGGNDRKDETPAELLEVAHTDKFNIFKRVIERIDQESNFRCENTYCYELPSPRSGSQAAYRTTTSHRVLCFVAVVYYKDLPFILIEIDTERMKKPHALSTLIVGFEGDSKSRISRVLQSCSDHGVKWVRDELKEICTFVIYCKHPTKTKKRGLNTVAREEEEYLCAWHHSLKSQIQTNYRRLIRKP